MIPQYYSQHGSGRCSKKHGSSGHGFTLTEMIVVFAIVSVLGVILIPAIAEARKASLAATCVSNLRQIGGALGLYIAENDGYFPPNRHNLNYHGEDTPDGVWEQDMLKKYLVDSQFESAGGGEAVTYREAGVFYCPADENRRYRNAALSYGSNYYLGVADERSGHVSAVRNPSRAAYMIDMVRNTSTRTGTAYFRLSDYPFGNNTNSGSQWAVEFRHSGKANILFVDGHVETLGLNQIQGSNPDNIRSESTTK